MEKIKQGYKQTDIGVIPEDWDVKPVKQIFDICNNFRLPISEEVRKKMQGIYPYYGPTRIQDYINEYRLEGEYALIGEDGDHFLKWTEMSMTQLTNGKFNVNNHAHIVKGKNNITTTKWFYYFFKNRDITGYLSRQGANRYKLSKATLNELPCIYPTQITEQTAIATALSDTDALIAALDKKIAKKQQIKQGAMQQLLTGKKRLPGFSGEWMEKKLGELCNIFGRIGFRGYTKNDLVPKGYGAITFSPSDIHDNKIDYSNCTYISLKKYEESPEIKVFNGDIIFVKTASIGKCAFIDNLKEKATINPQFVVFKNFKCNNYLLYYKLIHDDFQTLIQGITGGSTIPTMSQEKLSEIKMYVPSLVEEQTAIAQILTDMDHEIEQLEKERDKYKELKAGMMQVLLTGKVRLINVSVDNKPKVIVHESKPKIVNHNDKINEAVVISFLVDKFSSNTYPLSRFRYTKYAYLLHRQIEHVAKGFKKHAAGPYKSDNRYKGPENIAIKNKYIAKVENPKSGHDAFVRNENINQALNYFNDWYGVDIQEWIEQFRYYKNDDLEVLTTIDESLCDLKDRGTNISVITIKQYIASIPQWKHKLTKDCFCDLNIQKMIEKSRALFSDC